jgi:multiple sugar transport system substrate-binding protein
MLVPIACLAAGCSQNETRSTAATAKTEDQTPVTVVAEFSAAYREVFDKYMTPQLKAKLPWITIEYQEQKPSLQEKITAGTTPDILLPNGNLRLILDVNLHYDLTELIKKYKFDLTKLDPTIVKSIQAYGPKGEIYALPGDRSMKVLLYNKDIFKKFNEPYPKNGMSWDEVIALGKRLTRSENGVNYYGLNPASNGYLKSQLQLPVFDKDGKAQMTTPDWQKMASTWKAIYDIPGNRSTGAARDLFSKDRNTAMLMNNSSWLLRYPVPDFDWDYVTMPTFDNKLIPDLFGSSFSIASSSKVKDAAFQVIALYYSDEVQTAISKDAALVVGSSVAAIQKQYGSNVASAQGKNVQADFEGKAAIKVVEPFDYLATPFINQAFTDIADGKKDINTALREAEEKTNLKVAEEKARLK